MPTTSVASREEKYGIEAYRFEGYLRPFPKHFHDYFAVGLIECGKRCVTAGGKTTVVRAGSVLVFNPSEAHCCSPLKGEPLTYLGLNIPLKVFAESFKACGLRSASRFKSNFTDDPCIAEEVREIHAAVFTGSDIDPARLQQFVLNLTKALGTTALKKTNENANVVKSLFEENPHTALSLSALTKRLDLSTTTLMRVFSRETGMTPHRYSMALRVNRARELLQNGCSAAEAALDAGFCDQSHLSKNFLRCTGLTCGTYRSIFKNNRQPGRD